MTAEPHPRGKASTTLFRRPLALSAFFAVLSTLLLADLAPRYAPGLLRFEHYMGDVRTAILSDQLASQHPQVAIVAITDDTLAGYKTFLPVDRHLQARLVDALDAAGAKVIGLDFLFAAPAPDDNDLLLIDAIRRARAKVVLAAADERVGLTQAQREKQQAFLREVDRPAGYANLATERDSVVRFMAQPYTDGAAAYPKSFAAQLAESGGAAPAQWRPRIAWLRTPRDGSDVFLITAADTLLRPGDDPLAKIVREGLKDKIVLVGGTLREIDTHLTPLTDNPSEKMHGVTIHAHIAAQRSTGAHRQRNKLDGAAAGAGRVARSPSWWAGATQQTAGPAGKRRGQRCHHRRGHYVLAVPYHLPLVLARGGSASSPALHRQVAGPACGSMWFTNEIRVFLCISCHRLVATSAGLSPARADLHVIESTVAAIRVGSQLADRDSITIPAGAQIRVVLPSGKTQTIKGPYNGTVADLAKGQPINEGVVARMKNILQTGGATQATPGATRSIAPPAARVPRAAFSWSTIPVADGTVCIEKGAKLRLARVASAKAERVTLVDAGNGQQADVQWEAGSDTADWPVGVAPSADATYYVLVPDRPRRQITLRVLERLPAEDDVLSELHRLGCSSQFEAWVRGKLAAK
jgi:hypothetical protein